MGGVSFGIPPILYDSTNVDYPISMTKREFTKLHKGYKAKKIYLKHIKEDSLFISSLYGEIGLLKELISNLDSTDNKLIATYIVEIELYEEAIEIYKNDMDLCRRKIFWLKVQRVGLTGIIIIILL